MQARILVLGSGEIARCLARLAVDAGLAVTVSEADVAEHDWPAAVETTARVFTDAPWRLPEATHAVVARGHVGDPESVAGLLENGAERVYLIASARRAENVLAGIEGAGPERVSAPAGIDIGGQASGAIAVSILAEILWRAGGEAGRLRPAVELRAERLSRSRSGQRHDHCPGQRR